jgi:two-component system, chemotaxis family, protein-glutamate methylesterase/glutaminase
MAFELVVIGTSAGGLEAVCVLLGALPTDFPLPIIVVQHRSRDSRALCEVLQDCTTLPLHDVVDKEPLDGGHVYVAPADYHVMVENGYLTLNVDEPVVYSRPSIDVAFESAADAYGAGVIGVVLTGANRDGSAGLRRIANAGGHAIVQSPESAQVSVMPLAAAVAVPEAEILVLEDLAGRLAELARSGADAGTERVAAPRRQPGTRGAEPARRGVRDRDGSTGGTR